MVYDTNTNDLVLRSSYEYNAQNNLLAVYTFNGSDNNYSKTSYVYDTVGRLITKMIDLSNDSLNWTPSEKYEFQYSGLTIPNQYCINEFKRYLFNDFPVFSHDQVSHYYAYTWQNDQWDLYPQVDEITYQIAENANLSVIFNIAYSHDIISYTFNNLGQLRAVGQSYNAGSNSSRSITKTYEWSTWGLLNEDPTATPETPIQIEAYPNPFAKNISISSSRSNDVLQDIRVYNLKGQLIKQLPTSKDNNTTWDGTDSSGHSVANGVYFVRVKAGEKSLSKKIVLTK